MIYGALTVETLVIASEAVHCSGGYQKKITLIYFQAIILVAIAFFIKNICS